VLHLALIFGLALDLRNAKVVAPGSLTVRERRAATMLVEESAKRTQITWPVVPAASGPRITIGHTKGPAEGYRLIVRGDEVAILGNDERGVLFGAGRLLRELRMSRGSVTIADSLDVATFPKYPLRGHQLGYRPKTNSYDGWSVPVWEQYIRDLAVFGTNAIELIPPRSDDAPDSPHFPLPPMQMMIEMSSLADRYGLDVWIWYPAMDKDYSDPKTVELALNEWAEVFQKLPRINAVFVPGGDPGHTQPKHLMALLEKQTRSLHKFHPNAQMWMSPQGFSEEWMNEFLGILKSEPAWLSGVVFGPQIRMSLPQLREAVPKKYPIRHYPDITHSLQCQYPVPDWDVAYAVTEAREVINPRPTDEARIFRLLQPYTMGFLTYSEGCNDDVNKIVWSGLGWDPDADVTEILREYCRYFIGIQDFADGLLALERNWRGPLATNEGVYRTLEQFQRWEQAATPQMTANWRFQQGLYRAYYDAYTRKRLLYETAAEQTALSFLRAGNLSDAEASLDRTMPPDPWRARCFELAEALFQSIRMQLSVPRYKAISVDRGATLDTIDNPLNNRVWLKQRLAELRAANDDDRRKGIDQIVNWSDPGPGGFYDDLGNLTAQPHLVRGPGFENDPAFLESSLVGFGARSTYRMSVRTHAESLVDAPLRMRYTGLDPRAHYKLRVIYGGDSPQRKIRLVANEKFEIHPLIAKPVPYAPLEFEIPGEATAGGELRLAWTREPGLGGNGRGCQVSEVWLMKNTQ
jgi:hypothetical protein